MTPDPLIEQIERVRQQRQITLAALADGAGISRSTYAHARSGKHSITLHTLHALAAALGLEVRLAPVVLSEQFDAPKLTPVPRLPVTPARQEQNRKLLAEAMAPRWERQADMSQLPDNAAGVRGVTYRQLDHWTRRGWLFPQHGLPDTGAEMDEHRRRAGLDDEESENEQ